MNEWADDESTQGATMLEKIRVYGLWYGGASYGPNYIADGLEVFPDVEAAKDALLDRYRHGHWQPQDFCRLNGEVESVLTPSVDESTEMYIYYGDPTDYDDPYPDRRLYLAFENDDAVVMVDKL